MLLACRPVCFLVVLWGGFCLGAVVVVVFSRGALGCFCRFFPWGGPLCRVLVYVRSPIPPAPVSYPLYPTGQLVICIVTFLVF